MEWQKEKTKTEKQRRVFAISPFHSTPLTRLGRAPIVLLCVFTSLVPFAAHFFDSRDARDRFLLVLFFVVVSLACMHASVQLITFKQPSNQVPIMSKDVRRLFAAQKAAKATQGSGSPSLSSSSSASKRVTHPLAKYDPTTFRLTCAICGPNAPIKSDNLWNAHLISKVHQEAVAKLRAVKEQIQKREAEAAERHRLQQLQQQQQQQQGVKRKAGGGGGGGLGGLVAYAEDSESESDDDEGSATASVTSNDSKRVKFEEPVQQQEDNEDLEEEEDAMSGLPAGFFDAPAAASSTSTSPPAAAVEEEEDAMEGVLPAGFFDDPEEDSRVRAEVGGATADHQQRQVDEEFKALQADLAKDVDRQERQELEQAAQIRPGTASFNSASASTTVDTTTTTTTTTTAASTEAAVHGGELPYENKVDLEELELEESIMARSEEEYMLFVEMQERLDALREKKNRIASASSTPSIASPTTANSNTIPSTSTRVTKLTKRKTKSILDMVREQERAKREKERLAAEEFARLQVKDSKDEGGDSKMTSGAEDSEEEDSDEDIEAMMDWRAKRV